MDYIYVFFNAMVNESDFKANTVAFNFDEEYPGINSLKG
jgi:hypothetical protein